MFIVFSGQQDRRSQYAVFGLVTVMGAAGSSWVDQLVDIPALQDCFSLLICRLVL